MHQSCLGGIIIDCQTENLQKAARFWSQALGYAIRLYPNADENYITFDTPNGESYIEVQRVDHPSRVHLDIKPDDVEAEVGRLQELGARAVERIRHWCVMEAPTGHRFCVVKLHPGQDCGPLVTWDE